MRLEKGTADNFMADFFVWEPDKYALNIEEMDREHIQLISLMNQVVKRNEDGASKAEVTRLLEQLAAFTQKHFKNEEAYMLKVGYNGIATHKRIHADLLRDLQQHMQQYAAGSGRLTQQMMNFLKFWLMSHIRGFDAQYAKHVHQKSA